MSDQIWYVYQDSQQKGPFTKEQILQLVKDGKITKSVYLFRAGWKEWLPFDACAQELGLEKDTKLVGEERRKNGPRVAIGGQIIVHNQGDLVIGSGVNISVAGLFVETHQQLFKVGETLRLTCKVDRLAKPFHANAEVMHFNLNKAYPVGFGMRWTQIDPQVSKEVQKLVDQENMLLQRPPKVSQG